MRRFPGLVAVGPVVAWFGCKCQRHRFRGLEFRVFPVRRCLLGLFRQRALRGPGNRCVICGVIAALYPEHVQSDLPPDLRA